MKNLAKQQQFDATMQDYMIYCTTKQLSKRTLASYEQALTLFGKWLIDNGIVLKDVKQATIMQYISDIRERGKYTVYSGFNDNNQERRRDYRQTVSTTTINNYLRNLRAFFNWLYGDTVKNPMKSIRLMKNERIPKDFISDADFTRLLSVFDKSYFNELRDYTMIILMMDTGMRIGECTRLLVDDLDLRGLSIAIRAEETKSHKPRMVFFGNRTQKALKSWITFKDRYVESEYLFCSKANKQPVSVSCFETNFKRYINSSGLRSTISPHTLRNNFAKRSLMNGMDIYTLSRILGHSSVQVTEKAYLDLDVTDLHKQYARYSPMENMNKRR